jgi:hypothetical protein
MVVSLVCSELPEGHVRWKLELLCHHAAKQGMVPSVSKSEVALWLQEHGLKPCRKKRCVHRLAKVFRERMEVVLDLQEITLNPAEPVICLDEQPYQLLDDTRPSHRAGLGTAAWYTSACLTLLRTKPGADAVTRSIRRPFVARRAA